MKKIYGILAHPAGHSLSPAMHNAAFEKCRINGEYLYFDILPEQLNIFMDEVRKRPISGLSVSLPHKEAIIQFLDTIDERARDIGAVNTVINNNNQLFGTNTDWIGIKKAFFETLNITSSQPLGEKTVLILGASGAARAAIYAMKHCRVKKIMIVNRTIEKAQHLGKEFGCEAYGLEFIKKIDADIVINATSVGLYPQHETSLVPKQWWKENMIAFDMVYKPKITKFLQDAKAAGARIITGDLMLLYQGIEQFKLFTGVKAPIQIMKKAIEEKLKI